MRHSCHQACTVWKYYEGHHTFSNLSRHHMKVLTGFIYVANFVLNCTDSTRILYFVRKYMHKSILNALCCYVTIFHGRKLVQNT